MPAINPLLEVRRDVCVASYECGSAGGRLQLVKKQQVEPALVWKTHTGLTVLISAKHGASLDWSNLAHWTSACMYLAAAAVAELPGLGRFGTRLAGYAETAVRVALPQVVANRTSCGAGALVPALVARGSGSEMFAALALATAHVVVGALRNGSLPAPTPKAVSSSASPFELANDALLLCPDLAAPPGSYICFDGLVRVRWAEPARTHGLMLALSALNHRSDARSRRRSARRLHEAMRLVVGLPPPPRIGAGSPQRRLVVLLTRRTQSVWINHAAMADSFRQAVESAGAEFRDAGDAEELGVSGGCYRAAPQVELWSGAWLVVSPVGAHESNVVFMRPDSAGLLESLNCGHDTMTYNVLATAAGVPYAAARETHQQGHGWLAAASAPLLRQACQHLSLPTGCNAAQILEAKPRLYERKNCSGRSAKALLWLNMPRMHFLSGDAADVLRALGRRLGG